MKQAEYDRANTQKIAAFGGIYGNILAFEACLNDAKANRCHSLMFLGDAVGCCGHSDEALHLIHQHCDIYIAGNHEQQAAAGSTRCGCGYASPEDERLSCLAFEYALQDLSEENQEWMGKWADTAIVNTPLGRILLCHGSPDQTNEFLYESQLDDERLKQWLDEHNAVGFICTHSGLPWVRQFEDGRFAVNCGVVGKPDHDGDPAVHYALLDLSGNQVSIQIQRVEYDYETWTDTLAEEGVDPIFIEPLKTGIWTTGVSSLPPVEKQRYQFA
ncbi:MAG: metallophosphoesterase family protein [Halothece sp. Uz-M2-17]|nr:metallophosphoesterase family protein [Halothece sp. Uz-M2-17]